MPGRPKIRHIPLAMAFAAVVLAGCATNNPASPPGERADTDPWEPLNRHIYAFNNGVDSVTFKPLAKGYVKVVPQPLRQGVGNVSRNLRGPLYIVNNFLQGKVQRGFNETGRFMANTVFGLGGLIDISKRMGMDSYPEDFGETLAVWGVPDGPYVVVPVLGPHTLRDALMIPLNFAADPAFHIEEDRTRISLYVIRGIDTRAGLFAAEALIEDSFDRYLTLRESYLQNRQYRVYDGDPPVDDDFYDDFEDIDEDY